MKKHLLFIVTSLFIVQIISATNPEITKNLVNLTNGIAQTANEDFVPEMIIEGEIIHTSWTTYVSGSEAYLYYCRSTDLGETWENPIKIWQFKDGARGKEVTSQRLAVSGNNVYIAFTDYDYYNNGTGQVLLSSSANSGSSFGTAVEIVNSGGGYKSLDRSFIKAAGNNVAIAYDGSGAKEGIRLLFSSNNGTSFTETIITEDNNNMSDFWYDGNQLIVAHEWFSYSYGYLTRGHVYVSVSNNNGSSFTTNKVSVTYDSQWGEQEKCRCYHDQRYVPKIAKDGSNIHIIFAGNNTDPLWTILYARSTNNGQSFEPAVDINKGKIWDNRIRSGQESIVAKGGNVYMEYLSTSSKPYLVRSSDNGATLTEAEDLLTEETHYIQTTWYPQLVLDPTDETGKTLYFGSGAMMTRKSTNGGESFHNTTYLFPLFDADIKESVLKIDNSGGIHWITKGRWYWTYDYDIFYGKKKIQPEPGEENKAYHLKTTYNDIQETAIVPSSPSIEFDSVMTGEAWVKIKSGSGFTQNILSKVNTYDGPFYQSPGYQITFDDNYGKRRFESGILTDKGEFMNWTDTNLNDTLWHHIAITYDASAGLNNFKSYIDGLLVAEQTVLGAIIPGDGMLMIGSRQSVNNNADFIIDDVRLWNRALTQKELIENQIKTFTGNEDSLKLWLNFDDTFKDISGNGNDAIPLYLGDLKVSNFDPPLIDLETYQTGNVVSCNSKTKNASSYLWDFGNDETSDKGNPQYAYPNPGEYQISLIAKNATTVTSALGHASIKGLSSIEPAEAGNIGESLLTIYGGGLNTNMQVLLRSEGNTEIVADTVAGSGEDGFLQALFSLDGAQTGLWDVVVVNNDAEMVLPKSFTIKQAEGIAQPWVNVSGRSTVLLNRWTKYTITFGNKGDVDALMVPVTFAVPDIEGLEVDYMDFKFVLPELAKEYNIEDELMPYKDFIISDNIFGKPERSRIYSLMIPRIKANSSESLHILIKSPVNYKITSWTGDGWVKYTNAAESDTKQSFKGEQLKSATQIYNIESQTGASVAVAECITEALAVTVIETSISVIPVVGAIYNSGKTGYVVGQFDSKNKGRSVVNSGLQAASTFFSYAGVIPVVGWVASTVGGLVCGGISAYLSVSDCLSLANKEKSVSTVTSLDPNEIVGPDGYGDKGWIPKINELPYTIFFENKEEATAPAHDVFITDTLDLSKYDIKDFGFGSFGWGDTLLSPPGNRLKEFSMDVDLRPEKNLIARVSAKLDTLTGIINWEFLSLNPETMNLEEDPFIGFLPPNNMSPEGEGFVSFSVGSKEEHGTNDEVKNKASIVFDANKPIVTNTYVNTFDMDAPQSHVYSLDGNISNRFTVAWTGSDVGSGIASYTIYVLTNDTILSPWIVNTTNLSANFIGEVGSTYKFYSIATDNAGLEEEAPEEFDATTVVMVGVEQLELIEKNLNVYPNPANDYINIKLNNPPCGDYIIEFIGIDGTINHSQIYGDFEINSGIKIGVSNYVPGQYILRIIYGDKSFSNKVLVN